MEITEPESVRVVITGTFTVEPVEEFLRWWGERLGVRWEVVFGGFGQVFQELLDPGSASSMNAAGVNMVVVRAGEEAGGARPGELGAALAAAAGRGGRWLAVVCPSGGGDDDRAGLLDELSRVAEDHPNVCVNAAADWARGFQLSVWHDAVTEELGRIPFTREFFAVLGAGMARHVHRLTQPRAKVVAVDADNTLWQGVVGEAGVAGIRVSPACRRLQERLLALKRAGALLALVTKNDRGIIDAALRDHPDLVLRATDFVSIMANWRPKSENLRALAGELELGLASFVFLDDNPLEVAEVRAFAPEVVTIEVPTSDDARIEQFLDHVWALDAPSIATAEDGRRTEMYRTQARRGEACRGAASFQEFLDTLDLEVDLAPATGDDIPRLAQLTQRTNQFNALTRRRNEAELAAEIASGLEARRVNVRDRFGDYGMVGLLGFRPRDDALEVEQFLLSCRALGKGIEHRMVQALASEAEARGLDAIVIPLVPTERNEPMRRFLDTHFGGFVDAHSVSVYRIPLPAGAGCTLAATAGTFGPAPDAPSPSPATARRTAGSDVWQHVATALVTAPALVAAVDADRRRPRPESLASAFRQPADGLESSLAGIFSAILAVAPIGADDDFFALGGQSILATQVLARVACDHGIRLPLRALFDHPTAAELAAHLTAQPTTPRLVEIVPHPRGGADHPLSNAQRRMWFLDRYAPGSATYLIAAARRLEGLLDIEALRDALASLSRRHEILRAIFPERDGRPVQVFSGPPPDLVVDDHPFAPLDDFLIESASQMQPATGPLVRVILQRHAPDDHTFLLILHHILADGWSVQIFFRDLAALYTDHRRDRTAAPPRPLPLLRLQTLDFAAHQNARLAAGAFGVDLAYWRATLDHAPDILNLPTDLPRPAERNFDGAVAQRAVPAALVGQIEALGRRHRATVFMTLMAAWHALLHRWSGQSDILVGTPVSGRSDLASENLIGCFINSLVIRSQPVAGEPFTDLLGRIRDQSLGAFDHQDLPFEVLVEALGLRRSPSHTPLFQVMLVLQNAPAHDLDLPGITTRSRPVHTATAKFDLLLEATPAPDGSLGLTLEYATALFRHDTAVRLLDAFQTILQSIVAQPESPLGTLAILDPAAKREAIEGFNRHRDFPPPAPTLNQWFEQIAARFPDRIAVTADGESLTYDELNRRANQLASLLRSHGAGPEVPVAICLERSAALVIGLLGIVKSGAAYLPIDLSYPPERLAFMLDDAAAPVLLTQRSLAEKLPDHRARVLCLDDPAIGLAAEPDANPAIAATEDGLAYLIYTSGSTGRPKGCCVTHRNVTRLFSATRPWFGFDENDVWTLFHSYAFDFSVWELWGALLHGGRLVVVPYAVSRSPDEFYKLLVDQQVTVLNQTPSAFRQLIAADEAAGAAARLALRYVVFGGEALEMRSLEPWFARHGDRCPQLINMYGITETTVHVTYRPLSATDVDRGSVIGVPIPDLLVYVLDAALEPCPIGVPGELFVGGAGVARGYLRRDDLTGQRFLPSPFVPGDRLYRTGDLARRLPGRDIEYLGRIDRQVKIRGFRIELGEIESALVSHPDIREATVIAVDRPSGKQLAAYLVASSDLDTDTLRHHLRRMLPDYMVPAAWVFLDRLPLTANGKLDLGALPEPGADRSPAAGVAPPEGPEECTLAAVWEKVLRIENVGRHDNFFALGGDSILVIQVISLARQAGFPLTPRHLFDHQSIAELATCARGLTLATAATPGPQAAGPVALTPIQRWFVDQQFAGPNHWNQAFVFDLKRPLTEAVVRQALGKVLAHHDAFRLRLTGEVQEYATAPCAPWVKLVEPGGFDEAMERAHRAMNPATGPVVGAVLTSQHLFLCAHHNVIDGVSWRIVLEDLEAAIEDRELLPATATFQAWSRALAMTASELADASGEPEFWLDMVSRLTPALPDDATHPQPDLEAGAVVLPVSLTEAETTALLQVVPARLKARIDEILLAALTLGIHRVTGASTVGFHTEGHGREECVRGVDVSRTIGWFTSLYPVHLELPPTVTAATVLCAVKDRLRAIPNRGIGYGLMRYLLPGRAALAPATEPEIVFNYLGQLDGLVAGSRLWALSSRPAPAWHGPENRRTHAVSIDSFIRDRRLTTEFRLHPARHRQESAKALTDAFAAGLRELLAVPRALAPSDFPLVQIEPTFLGALSPALDDLWPLSPMQELFAGLAATKGGAPADRWHCRLHGPLDLSALQAAWAGVYARHPILRASIAAINGDSSVAVIHSGATAGWDVCDWSDQPHDRQEAALRDLLHAEAKRRLDLAQPPLTRLTLVRLGDHEHFLLWSVPDWMLDGWSWPVVIRELNALYSTALGSGDVTGSNLSAPRSYRDFLAWMARRDMKPTEAFWRKELAGVTAATPLPLDRLRHGTRPTGRTQTGTATASLRADDWEAVTCQARALGVTPMALLVSAWSMLIAQASRNADVVVGVAFSGRPAELPGIDAIVGPCTTNLPVRVHVSPDDTLASLATSVRDRIFAIDEHQFASPLQIQDWSGVPWRHRLFDSLIVFQNYATGDEVRRLGSQVRVTDFTGPVHSNHAITLVATPAASLGLELVFQEASCSPDRARCLVEAFASMLRAMAEAPAATTTASALGAHVEVPVVEAQETGVARHPGTRPRNQLERRIHAVWAQAFGPHVGVDDNFFDAGGHSLLAMRVLARLRSELGVRLTPADLFQFPTIAALARKLGAPAATTTSLAPPPNGGGLDAARTRAARARTALARRQSVP